MNKETKHFINSIFYTISSNVLSLTISAIVVLVIPKLFGIQEFGYWQLYAFYTSYVGFMHFGWNDGIYLRFGGYEYNKLDKKLFFSQFYMLVAFQLIIGIIITIFSTLWIADVERNFIILMSAVSMFILNVRYFLFFVLQATNRIKEFSKLTILDRLLYAAIIAVMLAAGIRNYRYLIYADLVARGITLIFTMFSCQEIVFGKISEFRFTFGETKLNISAGIKLMVATIASFLITGVVRFGIERAWDIETFGKISLTISISNLVMVFINTLGIVMYPLLRRNKVEDLGKIYKLIRNILTPILLGVLIFYTPLKFIFLQWLPNYEDSIRYMAIIFPIVIYEGQMSLLVNTFYKTIRMESKLLYFNVLTLILSVLLTLVSVVWLHNLELSVVSILVLLMTRGILSELWITKRLELEIRYDIVMEALLTFAFILSNWYTKSLYGFAIYSGLYLVYIVAKRRTLASTFKEIVRLTKKEQ